MCLLPASSMVEVLTNQAWVAREQGRKPHFAAKEGSEFTQCRESTPALGTHLHSLSDAAAPPR